MLSRVNKSFETKCVILDARPNFPYRTCDTRVWLCPSPLDNNSTATVAPLAEEPEPVVAQISAEDYPAYQDYYYGGEGTYPPEYYEELPATTNLPLEQDQEAKTTFEEAERDEAAQPEAEPSISLHSGIGSDFIFEKTSYSIFKRFSRFLV